MHSLDHTNVLKFYEWYETPKHIWVITELASGGTLYEILEQDVKIPPDKVEDFIRDIASGLNYLHSVGIVYSDLQPKKVSLRVLLIYVQCDIYSVIEWAKPPHFLVMSIEIFIILLCAYVKIQYAHVHSQLPAQK